MGFEVIHGDALTVLSRMEAGTVQTCVTSPPYFGLRDYGIEGQIGLERTPDEYVARLVEVFGEVRRVLRDDGTLWLNLGDSYAGSWGAQSRGSYTPGTLEGASGRDYCLSARQIMAHPKGQTHTGSLKNTPGCKPKDLIGIPWMVAFALRADGWYLRSDIIWSKPNPMPESVTDRPTKAHEYLFLLSKSERYYYDADAIKEDSCTKDPRRPYTSEGAWQMDGRPAEQRHGGKLRPQIQRARELAREKGLTEQHIAAIRAVGITDAGKAQVTQNGFGNNRAEVEKLAAEAKAALGGYYREFLIAETRNRRSVWTVATKPYAEAHFATFPEDLIAPCVKAGCPVGGTVLDPFSGAGTTGVVAVKYGRNYVGIELNPDYVAMSERRIASAVLPLFAPSTA